MTAIFPRTQRDPVPGYFMAMCSTLLRASRRTAEEVWTALEASQLLRYHLGQCARWPSLERQKRVMELLPPRALLEATWTRWPEGQSRPKEIIELEETVLALTASDGTWRW